MKKYLTRMAKLYDECPDHDMHNITIFIHDIDEKDIPKMYVKEDKDKYVHGNSLFDITIFLTKE